MTTKEHRKAIPVGVKLHACLLLLGYTEDEIAHGLQWDHTPPLGLRFVDPDTGVMTPAPNDPRHIVPMRTAAHRHKTSGRNRDDVANSDVHKISKVKRLNGETKKKPKGRPIRSAPFPKRIKR